MHDGRAAVVTHLVRANRFEDEHRIDLAQADVGSGIRGHGPWEAPAIAMKHRQRPQKHAIRTHAQLERDAERVQVRAAVGADHSLGFAGRTAGVIDADGLVFIGQRRRTRVILAGLQE